MSNRPPMQPAPPALQAQVAAAAMAPNPAPAARGLVPIGSTSVPPIQ